MGSSIVLGYNAIMKLDAVITRTVERLSSDGATRAVDSIAVEEPLELRAGNEALAVILMAARFGKPVCPHAGGVGLCEYVQHLSIFDYIVVSGSLAGADEDCGVVGSAAAARIWWTATP